MIDTQKDENGCTMTPQETARMQAEVLIAFAEGKTIQCRRRTQIEWLNVPAAPLWNWSTFDYRIKPAETKQVKLAAFVTENGQLCHFDMMEVKTWNSDWNRDWKRVPSLDLEYEVTE